jgi:AbrB family looped-hinge helix DNA binding protein
MAVPRVTIKGQVTIPRAIRSAMDIEAGDGVIFRIEGQHVVMVPVKRRSLRELYGALPVKKLSPGIEEERRIAREHIARHVMGGTENNDD